MEEIDTIKRSGGKILWPEDTTSAINLQEALKAGVVIAPLKRPVRYVAGVDAAFFRDRIIGAACLFKYPEITLLDKSHSVLPVRFPYVPGFLSFREGPALIAAIKKLKKRPDLIIFDGQGIAHPRGMGVASHIGLLLGIPSLGCAKSRLVGAFREPGKRKGCRSALRFKGRTVGAVLRTRDNTKPLFVSPGHLIDISGSVEIVLSCTRKYRLPEPVRCADRLSKSIKKALKDPSRDRNLR